MPSVAPFMLLLILPLHACIALRLRHLDIVDRKTLLPSKDVEISTVLDTFGSLKGKPSLETEERLICNSEAVGESRNYDRTTTMKLKELNANPRMEGRQRKMLGTTIVSSAPEEMRLPGSKIQGRLLKSIGRYTMESASNHSDKTADSDDGDEPVAEDMAVVMDYAQPHRKPPIHNHNP